MEDLFFIILEAFQNNKILLRLLDAYDVNDLIFESDFERKNLFADLAVDSVES